MARFRSPFLPDELGCFPQSVYEGYQSISVMSVCRDVSGTGIHVRKPPAVFLFVGGTHPLVRSFRGQTASRQVTKGRAPNNLQKVD